MHLKRGQWNNFRNETFNGVPFLGRGVEGRWFVTMPNAGKLRLDYAATTRPLPGTRPLSVRRFWQVLAVRHVYARVRRGCRVMMGITVLFIPLQRTSIIGALDISIPPRLKLEKSVQHISLSLSLSELSFKITLSCMR